MLSIIVHTKNGFKYAMVHVKSGAVRLFGLMSKVSSGGKQ